MRDIPLTNMAGLPAEQREALAHQIAAEPTLADVLAGARAARPPRVVAEIVTQDEYTHDVVVSLHGDRWLVYDTT